LHTALRNPARCAGESEIQVVEVPAVERALVELHALECLATQREKRTVERLCAGHRCAANLVRR
jgi:hypothetical protein